MTDIYPKLVTRMCENTIIEEVDDAIVLVGDIVVLIVVGVELCSFGEQYNFLSSAPPQSNVTDPDRRLFFRCKLVLMIYFFAANIFFYGRLDDFFV